MEAKFYPKLETLNEFIKEMKTYNCKCKTKHLSLNLNNRKTKIYNINLTTNFKPKINENRRMNKVKSFSNFSFFNKKVKDNNNINKYQYNDIYIYKYKKKDNMNEKIRKINSIKDREKYLVRGFLMTNQTKKYFEKCLKKKEINNNILTEKQIKINNNDNIKKTKPNIKRNTLKICYSLNNFIKHKFPLIIK